MIVKSDEEKKEVLARVQSRIEQGQAVVDAAKAEGFNYLSQYYDWKKQQMKRTGQLELPVPPVKKKPGPKPGLKLKPKRPEPYVQEIETPPAPASKSKMACIIGTPQDIGEILRSMK